MIKQIFGVFLDLSKATQQHPRLKNTPNAGCVVAFSHLVQAHKHFPDA